MTNDGWGDKWPSGPIFPQQLISEAKRDEEEYLDMYVTEVNPVALGVNSKFDEAADKAMSKASCVPWPKKGEGGAGLREITEYKLAEGQSITKDDLAGGPVFVQTSDVSGVWLNFVGWDKAIGSDKTTIAKIENGAITKIAELKSQGSNLVDNEQHLYFQCDSCNEILDPNTKSFAKLQEYRVNAGWKCIWNIDGMGYKVYCAKCGENVK